MSAGHSSSNVLLHAARRIDRDTFPGRFGRLELSTNARRLNPDAHTELLRARKAAPPVDLGLAEERSRARFAVAMMGGVPEDAREESTGSIKLSSNPKRGLFEARRKTRVEAVAQYEAAAAAEQAALAKAGVDSYASFLVASVGGAGPDDGRRAAQQELIDASMALDAAQRAAGTSDNAELHRRGVELRARAERLLGRTVVGGDPPGRAPGHSHRVAASCTTDTRAHRSAPVGRRRGRGCHQDRT